MPAHSYFLGNAYNDIPEDIKKQFEEISIPDKKDNFIINTDINLDYVIDYKTRNSDFYFEDKDINTIRDLKRWFRKYDTERDLNLLQLLNGKIAEVFQRLIFAKVFILAMNKWKDLFRNSSFSEVADLCFKNINIRFDYRRIFMRIFFNDYVNLGSHYRMQYIDVIIDPINNFDINTIEDLELNIKDYRHDTEDSKYRELKCKFKDFTPKLFYKS